MTSFDVIEGACLAQIQIDTKMMSLFLAVSEEVFNIIVQSKDYSEFYNTAINSNPPLRLVSRNKFEYMRERNFATYEDYVEDNKQEFLSLIDSYLLVNVHKFDNCTKLEGNIDTEKREINADLTIEEINILAKFSVITWMDKEINDTTQITAMIQDKETAHRYSEAALLDAKKNMKNVWTEDVMADKSNYGTKIAMSSKKWRY